MFNKSSLLITGGTGSFGGAVLNRFLNTDISEIRIFSRDEKKQDDMRKKYSDARVKFYLGDVRDAKSVARALRGVDYIFHAAALKQVPSCEFHPMEAVLTNIIGTDNVISEAVIAGVKKIVCLGTDKAVYPINAMGISKALMEKVMVAASRNLDSNKIIICGTRYGNVMGSRGSVIPLFMSQIQLNKPITITDPTMTRFMMSLEDAVDLVLFAFNNGTNGDIFVQKSPAATVQVLADAMAEFMGKRNYPIEILGARHGEKLYESLLGKEELANAEDLGAYYKISADGRDLNYEKYIENGENKLTKYIHGEDYNSHNTRQLNGVEMLNLLRKIDMQQLS